MASSSRCGSSVAVASAGGLAQHGRQHQRQPVAAGDRQPARHRRPGPVVPRPGQRHSPIVLHATSGQLTDSKYAGAVNQAAADVAKDPNVAAVVNPLTPQGAAALSKDKTTGYLSVTLAVPPGSLSVQRRPEHHRCRRPGQGGGAPGRDRRAAGPEGLEALDRVKRADRDHRRDGHPDLHLRDRGVDAAADPHGDLRPAHHAVRSSASSATS